jgi:predicted Zn-dependent peptidase
VRPGQLLTAGLGLACLLLAPAAEGGSAVERTRLPNGMVVLVRTNETVPAVAVSLFVRVGGWWEDDDSAGVTNLLQQVMMKGTTTRSALEIVEAAERMGGSIGASVDPDFAEIRGTALVRHWPRLLELVADVTFHPQLAEAEIAIERRNVLTAIRSRADQPFQRAFDTLLERLYPAHPYGKPAVGRIPVVETLTRDALVAHHRRFYRPDRMVLSVSGQVRSRDVTEEALRLFTGGGESPPPRLQPVPEPPVQAERLVVTHPAAQAQVLFGFLAPPVGHPDYAPVKVLTAVFGGGMAGRLFVGLRDKEGLAYSTGAVYPSRARPSFIVAYLGTAPANVGRAEQGLRRELQRIRDEPPSIEEVARAKAYLLGQFVLDRRTNARLAWYQGFYEATGVGDAFAARYVQDVEAVTVAEVHRVASQYLASPAVVVLQPPAR